MSTIISKDGTSIAYETSGAGQPIILVDGAMCSRAFGPMTHLAPLLAKHFTVYTYDRRGRNESGDTQPYAAQREVEDLDALIQAAGGSAYLYGISSGAALVAEAAATGLNVPRMALYEPPFTTDESMRPRNEEYTRNLRQAVAEGRRGDAVELFMLRVGQSPEEIAGMRQAPFWYGLEAIGHTLAYDDTIMGDGFVPVQRYASVKVPALVMAGGASPDFLQNAARAAAEALPNAQFRILEGQTHDVAADAIAPALIDFFTVSTTA